MISFFVPGIPKPAGSKRGFAIKKDGKYTGKTIVIDSSGQKGKDWRGDIKRFAMEHRPDQLLDGPLDVKLVFHMKRPKIHFKKGFLRDDAPSWHTNTPDVLKLARAVEDALTEVIWTDDKLIVTESLSKTYAIASSGVTITVSQYGAQPESEE